MECAVYEKSTNLDEAKSTITDDDERSTAMSEKSTTLDEAKSTITDDDERSNTMSEKTDGGDERLTVTGMKRKIDVDSDESDEEDYITDVDDESEEEDWSIDEPVDEDILIDGRRITNEELVSWMSHKDDPDYDYRKTNKFLNKLRLFLKSLWESNGFEAEHWPGSTWGISSVVPRKQVIQKRHRYPEGYKYLMFLAHKAIMVYNTNHHTNYKVDRIVNMNSTSSMGYTYYITFTASNMISIDNQTFQATVWNNVIECVITVISCQLKPGGMTYQSTDSETMMVESDDKTVIGSKSHLEDEQLWKLIDKDNPNRGVKNKDKYLKKVRSYLESIENSEGFECTNFPGRISGLTSIEPRQEIILMRNKFPEFYHYLCLLSLDAIKVYNKAVGTQFNQVCVNNANSLLVMGYGTYYITFSSADPQRDYLKCTFEAKVSDEMFGWNVDFCRRKTEPV